jgi:predicted phage terminase large subunit-like protein
MQQTVLDRLRLESSRKALSSKPLELPKWDEWLAVNFPSVCTYPHGSRHVRLWEWIEQLTPGSRVPPRVDVWPRGGGKSSVGELGVTRTGAKLSRRFALYLSETQDQANLHVQAIGTLMETLGMERALNQYGNAKGWKVNLLRTANGFNVLALGLDSASRGVKLDQYRPDFILCDDLDNQGDTIDTVDKKIRTLTTAILPAGSADCAVLFLQNKIHKNGIVAQLCDGRADFLHDREPAHEEPAVIDLQVGTRANEHGANVYEITAGVATWEGQNLEVCAKQINTWGLKAFRREAQHEVEDADGIFFRTSNIRVVKESELPLITRVCLAWDLAATESGGDHTVGLLLGLGEDGKYYILAIIRGQWSSERVRQVIALACETFLPAYPKRVVRFPQDPGQAGKDQVKQLQTTFAKWNVRTLPVTGSKSDRATNAAEGVNLGNVCIVERDLPAAFAPFVESLSFWHFWPRFQEVLRNFKEDVSNQPDDDVDAFADSWNELCKTGWAEGWS